jgi:hypothetical protein
MDETSKLLQKLKSIDPESLAKAHDEMITGFNKNGEPIAEGDATFEVDGKLHRIPFDKLREALQGKAGDSSVPPSQSFRGRIPKDIGNVVENNPSPEFKPDSNYEDGYYWDKNYNYEYMHPEAIKDRVLTKPKK